MENKKPFPLANVIIYTVLILVAIYTLMPLMILVFNSFKPQSDIVSNPLALPTSLSFGFITKALAQINFGDALLVTVFITVVSVGLIVLISSCAAWIMVRHKGKASNVLFMLFVAAMLVPFQAIMFPLISFMDNLGLKNLPGLIIMYCGFGLSLSVFLYHGFIKGVPADIEEAAVIDGANVFQLFFQIVFPLLQSITVTVIILNAMWIWNDYLLPFLVIGNSDNKTLTLALYYAKMQAGQYGNPWELIFPAVFISVIPIIIAFLFLQKYIVKGISAGAVKG